MIEDVVHAVAGTLASGLLLWIASQVWRISQRIAVIETKLEIMQHELYTIEKQGERM